MNTVDSLKYRVGFLCYDLQSATEDCAYRIAQVLFDKVKFKAFPLFFHPQQENARIENLPAQAYPRLYEINQKGITPDGLLKNWGWRTSWHCLRESDIIILFGLLGAAAIWTAVLGFLSGKTVISVMLSVPAETECRRRWWVKLLKRVVLKCCRYHIYQSETAREVLMTVYGIPEQKMFFAPFEAGGNVFRTHLEQVQAPMGELRQNFGFKEDEIVFLYVGNIVPLKGIDVFLEASAKVSGSARFRVVIIGREDPHASVNMSFYKAMARKLNIEERTQFISELPYEQLAALYLAADVVVLPTRRDTFGKVLVEGALAHKPLITTTACGSIGMIVKDQENGLVVPVEDAEALADAMVRMFDKNVRKAMGEKSYMLVRHYCDPELETAGFKEAILAATACKGQTL